MNFFHLVKPAILFLFLSYTSKSYSQDSLIAERYTKTLADIQEAFNTNLNINFKKVNFLIENTYFNNQLDYGKYDDKIRLLAKMTLAWMAENPLKDYRYKDSADFQKKFAIYTLLKDSIKIVDGSANIYIHLPYTYDFNDLSGSKEWSNMFVSKLLAT